MREGEQRQARGRGVGRQMESQETQDSEMEQRNEWETDDGDSGSDRNERLNPTYPIEKCCDCGTTVNTASGGVAGQLCLYCDEPVCDACMTGHGCDSVRVGRTTRWR